MTSLYRILGVSRHDGDTQIKSAYRRLVKQLHPDLHPPDIDVAERFKDVSRAYAILSDPTKRSRYDRGEIDGNGAQQRTFGRATKKTNIHRNGNGFEPFQQGQKSAPDVFQRFFSRSDEKSAFSAARGDTITK